MSEPQSFIFEIFSNGARLNEVRVTQDVIKIGSHAKSHLQIEDSGVARVHAVIEVKGDTTWLIDLGSGRGTNLNGERVNKAKLNHRDRIQVGSHEIVVFMFDEKAQHAAQAAHDAVLAAAVAQQRRQVDDTTLYSRRFLSRPASTDGTVEIAMLYNDFVVADAAYQPPRDVTIGSSENCDYPVEHPSLGETFNLIEAGGGSPSVQFTSAMTGDLYIGTEQYTLKEAVKAGKARMSGNTGSIPLTADTRLRLQVGSVTFFLHRGTSPKLLLPIEMHVGSMLPYIGASLVLHALFMLLVFLVRPEIGNLGMDGFSPDDRFVQILLQEEEEEEEIPEEELFEDEGEEEEAEREAGDEGRAGDENEEETDNRMAVEGDNDPSEPTELAMREAREEAEQTGIVSVVNQFGPTSIFGGMESSGYDDAMAIGAISDGPIGASYGTSGLGRYGGGLSGGGTHTGGGFGGGSIGIGRSGGDGDVGRDQVGINRDRERRSPSVVPGDPEIRGQLDRDIIARVIREHRREVRNCYESELQANPDLEGRVVVRFVISPDGSVASADIQESDLNNSAVESCVTRRVTRWRFPEPRGGGIVRVSYPFAFTSG